MRIETTAAFERSLRSLSAAEFTAVAKALLKLPGACGRPHEHSGIRKLRGATYEMRVGLAERIVFRREPDCLFLLFLGDHDAIRRFLRDLK